MKESKKYVACVAHDGKKPEMVQLVMNNLAEFKKVNVVATGTTGRYVAQAGIDVLSVLSGPLGGDAQIASMVATGEIVAVVFLIDPLDVHPHQVDVSMLLRICNVYNVPLATNKASAEILIKHLTSR